MRFASVFRQLPEHRRLRRVLRGGRLGPSRRVRDGPRVDGEVAADTHHARCALAQRPGAWPGPHVSEPERRRGRVPGRAACSASGRTQPPGGRPRRGRGDGAPPSAARHGERARPRGRPGHHARAVLLHRGRTGPCTEAIVSAGITRVVDRQCAIRIARVSGSWHPRSSSRTGVRGRDRSVPSRRSVASTTAASSRCAGAGTPLRDPEARHHVSMPASPPGARRVALDHLVPRRARFVHRLRLRARIDGVMVGSGTALADDPALTARQGETASLRRPDRGCWSTRGFACRSRARDCMRRTVPETPTVDSLLESRCARDARPARGGWAREPYPRVGSQRGRPSISLTGPGGDSAKLGPHHAFWSRGEAGWRPPCWEARSGRRDTLDPGADDWSARDGVPALGSARCLGPGRGTSARVAEGRSPGFGHPLASPARSTDLLWHATIEEARRRR